MRKLTPILFGLLLASTAHATSHRTFVSASGTDTGACGSTTPCRTLTYALSQTNSGGEIVITQSGGYGDATGGLVIDKSVSIIAEPGVFAALAPTTGNGITIATAGVKVVVKGLTITGRGGTNGISMTNGTSLVVEKSTISGFPSGGHGLNIQTAATVNVVDAVIRDNSYGIFAGTGGTVGVSNSKVLNNSLGGIRIYTTTAVSGVTTTVNINDTVVFGSNYCVDNDDSDFNIGVINATRVTATQCNGAGFYNGAVDKMTVSGSIASDNGVGFSNGGTLIVSGSTASNNTYGFYRSAGSFVSLGNNTVYGNGTNISGVITPAALQ